MIFSPKKQIYQQRAKNQNAVYVAQMDLRYDLTEFWAKMSDEREEQIFIKLTLPKGTKKQCSEWLRNKGITKKYLFPEENDWIT